MKRPLVKERDCLESCFMSCVLNLNCLQRIRSLLRVASALGLKLCSPSCARPTGIQQPWKYCQFYLSVKIAAPLCLHHSAEIAVNTESTIQQKHNQQSDVKVWTRASRFPSTMQSAERKSSRLPTRLLLRRAQKICRPQMHPLHHY